MDNNSGTPEVTIHIGANTPALEIKQLLAPLTGIPPQHQKLMLSAINQIVVADKR